MRKSIVIFETVIAGASILLWGIMLALSLGIPYPNNMKFITGGGSFPLLLCVILIILNLVWIINNIQILREGTDAEGPPVLTYLFGTKQQFRRLLIIVLLVLLYVFAMIPLGGMVHPVYGFPAATSVYLIVSIKLFGDLSWPKTILVGVVTAGLLFFAMNNMLMLPMPR